MDPWSTNKLWIKICSQSFQQTISSDWPQLFILCIRFQVKLCQKKRKIKRINWSLSPYSKESMKSWQTPSLSNVCKYTRALSFCWCQVEQIKSESKTTFWIGYLKLILIIVAKIHFKTQICQFRAICLMQKFQLVSKDEKIIKKSLIKLYRKKNYIFFKK